MITEQDLQEAIAECQGERHPNASTCIKLAAFYTIREHLYPDQLKAIEPAPVYSFAGPPEEPLPEISYGSETEFGQLITGRNPEDVWPVIDELVTAIQVMNPRLYASFIDKLQ